MLAVRKRQKIYGLDALRGIGITGIVLYHLFPQVIQGGFLGVPLFFVISGYLMFHISEAELSNGHFTISNYYKKRIYRIYPSVFILVMVVCCYFTLFQKEELNGIRQEVCSIFLGFNNWWQIHENASYFTKFGNTSFFKHLWFLAVEMQIYLLWPFIFLLYHKGCHYLGKRKMAFFFLGLALLSAGKMFFLYTPGTDPSRVYYGTDTIAFPTLLGIFLGAALQGSPHRVTLSAKQKKILTYSFYVCLSATIIFFFTVNGQNAFIYKGGMFFISIIFMFMVYITGNNQIGLGIQMETFPVSIIGKKSFLIYLWHYPIIQFAESILF